MAKRGSGGWFKRVRKGNITTTYSNKGMTTSTSFGSTKNGGTRTTFTYMPGGKIKTTNTYSSGNGWFRRESKIIGGSSKKRGRPRKVKFTKVGLLSYIILFFIIIIIGKHK